MALMLRLPLLVLLAGWLLAAGSPAGGSEARAAGDPLESENRPVLGASSAPVTVVEVASFQCAHCRDFHQRVFPALRAEYVEAGKVRWIVLNASDDPSEQFAPVFLAARCALAQGRYWELLETFFQVATRPPSVQVGLLARSPQVDQEAFGLCRQDRATRLAVEADFAAYGRLKVRGTPTFLLSRREADGGRTEAVIAGAATLAHFREVLDALLRRP